MTRVIGVGSPFGADRLGWEAIDHLAGLALGDCELLKLDRPGSALLGHLHNQQRVVLIDAVALDESPGAVSLLDLDDLEQLPAPHSSHGFGLAETLALAAGMGDLPPAFHLLGIHTGEDRSRLPALDTQALERLLLPLLRKRLG